MSIKSKNEIMDKVKELIGEDTSDETLGFIQDLSDTLENGNSDRIQELERQVEETDSTWRKKYRDTFFSGKPDPEMDDEPDEPKKPRNFSDLFKTN
jgi:hypothetical protein